MVSEIIIGSFAALAAGFIDAIAGGGGIITFPTLMMLGLPVPLIVGTNKLVSTCGTSIAAITFYRSGNTTKDILKIALPFTAIGSFIGAWTVLHLSNDFLKPLAGVIIFSLAIYLVVRPSLGAVNEYRGITVRLGKILVFCATFIGFYDGFFGPGTGMFLTYVMIRFMKLDFVRAAGNTKILNLASNVVPLVYFLSQGNIRFDLGIPMGAANMLGGYLGARSAIHAGPWLVRAISIIMAVLLGVKLVSEYLL